MTRSLGRFIASIFTACLALAPPSFAFEVSLSGEAVREAYFLGQRNDDKTAAFFTNYARHLPRPKMGLTSQRPSSSLRSPKSFGTQLKTLSATARNKRRDYEARGDMIEVRVRVDFTTTYTGIEFHHPSRNPDNGDSYTPRPLDFWKDFGFALTQNKEGIPSSQPYAEPIVGEDGTHLGAYVWFDYNASEVNSGEVSFTVDTPDGQHVVTSFDLSRLR